MLIVHRTHCILFVTTVDLGHCYSFVGLGALTSDLWCLVVDLWMRRDCGQWPSWTSSSAWTRWRNPSRPQPSSHLLCQMFPWTNQQHRATREEGFLLVKVSMVCSSSPGGGFSNMSEVQMEKPAIKHTSLKVYLSRQGLFWACSLPAQPCYMCTVNNIQSLM